jgi:16S rRNA (cytosine967-C5)-methyltransferase
VKKIRATCFPIPNSGREAGRAQSPAVADEIGHILFGQIGWGVYTLTMPVSPARKIAFDVLYRVAAEGAYASELLNTRLGAGVSRADAALATELTLGVLRWQRLLDFLLERYLDRSPQRLDVEVLIALRLGLYQMRFLERVPAHAAVSQSVDLVKGSRKRSAAPLVNAVLRRAAPAARASTAELKRWLPAAASPAERAAILYSHPTWLVERWQARFGTDQTLSLLKADNRPPALSCTVLDPARVEPGAPPEPVGPLDAVAAALAKDGLRVAPGRWLRSALILSGGNPAAAAPFLGGQINLQDEASQMVAHLVNAQAGRRVLDLCAAPGGKTTLLARAVAPANESAGGFVVAADLHLHRLRSMLAQLARTQTLDVYPVSLDATQPLPFSPRTFDRILVDAPCSGTGTLARNPEIRWRLEPAELAAAHRSQVTMLSNALPLLAPGGRLVYSTCSLEPEENEQVVHEALAENENGNVRIVCGRTALAPWLGNPDSASALFDVNGFFRTFPPHSGTDGFFAAVLERTA